MTVKQAAIDLAQYGIHCRRDWGSTGRWLAEIGSTQYCVGGLDLIGAIESGEPIAYLDKVCD